MNIILLCGSSCSGKTYIRDNILINSNSNNIKFNKVTQVTTRAPRDNEEKNNSYIFLSENEYNDYNNSNLLIAKTNVNGKRYGTLLSSLIDEDNTYNIIIVNKLGWLSFMESYKNDELKFDNLNIKTVRVLSDIPTEELKSEHDRSLEFIYNEINELDSIPTDCYIDNHNYKATYDNIINEFKKTGVIK